MSAGQRIPHHAGLRVAVAALEALAGTYERAAIAGSLRRGKPEVGDIELVVKPAFRGGINLLEERAADLLRTGVMTLRRKADGSLIANARRYKALVFQQLPLDLFIVLPDRHFGCTMTTRTGPHLANTVLVTPTGVRNREGLLGVLPRGLKFDGGAIWNGSEQLHTPEEAHVFAACGLPWIPPHLRSAELYQDKASGQSRQVVSALIDWPVTTDMIYVEGKPVKVDIPEPVASGEPVEQLTLL